MSRRETLKFIFSMLCRSRKYLSFVHSDTIHFCTFATSINQKLQRNTHISTCLTYMLCYIIWLFIKCLSQKAIQRHSQRDRLVKMKVFKLRRDADDIPCSITLRSAEGVSSDSFQNEGPTTAKADSGIKKYINLCKKHIYLYFYEISISVSSR